ncbi:uncharacterized protein LOC131243739 isoform X2 [Magnolia sinica]|uniref:uncharacterized protein LOC131243739 isoform X2 n=1 Tax=Magnolia sinica TaxID=86752 RepID=UPI002658C1AD|nr:uncharacterized protein LOC131243739 isoform X2 [Magnolia sinica]
MKFEDFLMQRGDDQQKRLDLEDEVVKLQGELDEELRLNGVLRCALHRPAYHRPFLSPLLPLQAQVLLAEVAMVEEEIDCLERKIQELKLHLYQEKQHNNEWKLQQHQQKKHFLFGLGSHKEIGDVEQSPPSDLDFRSQRPIREKKASEESASEIRPTSCARFNDEEAEMDSEKPNKLAEDLIKCLISIFLKLNRTPSVQPTADEPSSAAIPKLALSCMSSRGFMSKTTFNCKTPMSDDHRSTLDPYGVLSDQDGPLGDVGPYKNFIHFTKSSLDMSRVSECLPAVRKLRVLMDRLCSVDLSLLTYKQKLAFWINAYNACIMNAFLQHGLPSTPDKLLALMNKAVLNVGGIVLNALAIEHFILRHPCELKYGAMDEKEALLRRAYGLGYPEPNITFALCRGSWTSPALRVYTAEDVVSELEKAKVEYLEASVAVSRKKKILVPKLLHWHMRDFVDDVETLLEWIYSQLPRSGPLKRSMMECLYGDTKLPIARMVQIQPYESEFRYLLPP